MYKALSTLMLWVFGLIAVAAGGSAVTAGEGDTIVTAARESGSFKTLVKALGAADLAETLQGDGPFTVFAPTDKAFAALPRKTLNALLHPDNREKLRNILLYHVVEGERPAGEVVNLAALTTLGGQRIGISRSGGMVRIDDASIEKANIRCANGIIHAIDSVLMPATQDLVKTAASAEQFETLLKAAKAAGLVEVLRGDGPLTVLAPTDDAFGKLSDATLQSLLRRENRDKLAGILKYHVIPGRVYADQAVAAGSAETAQGDAVRFAIRDGQLRVNGARIRKTDIQASNGVIHVIDEVLVPDSLVRTASLPKTGAELIEYAIERGAPLFNAGSPEGCVAVYETAAAGLAGADWPDVPAVAQERLRRGLMEAGRAEDARAAAWALRGALDDAYEMANRRSMAAGDGH